MGVAGYTSPSSGLEHLISHLLDMHANAHRRPAALHGSQVGVGSIVAAATWERLRAALRTGEVPRLRLPDPDVARQRVTEAFRHLGTDAVIECWTAYSAKLRQVQAQLPTLQRMLEGWERVDQAVDRLLVPPDRLAAAMRELGAPVRFADLRPGYEPDVARWAIANGHLMRDRFTVADLVDLVGLGGEDGAAAVLGELATIGAGP
jgi:glycerol-1-phosphate dehydrogenase [NAD(P)+]